jgi:hypothetical protein
VNNHDDVPTSLLPLHLLCRGASGAKSKTFLENALLSKRIEDNNKCDKLKMHMMAKT